MDPIFYQSSQLSYIQQKLQFLVTKRNSFNLLLNVASAVLMVIRFPIFLWRPEALVNSSLRLVVSSARLLAVNPP